MRLCKSCSRLGQPPTLTHVLASVPMEVRLVPQAREELRALPPEERAAMLSAFKKLEAAGIMLGAPHTSQVKGSSLREFRPR